MATVTEIPESRKWTDDPPSLITAWQCLGEFDDQLARIAARSAIPTAYLSEFGTLYRQPLQIDEVGFKQYRVTAAYAPVKYETGQWTFDFDTTGGTVHISTAREHINTYPSGGDIHKCSINVKQDGTVEGADISIPALKFTIRYRHPHGVVTMPFVKNLARITGAVNSTPMLTFAAGELLYAGATGSDGTEAEAELAHSFIASENATGLSFGAITGINKGGHELLWVEHVKKEESGKASTQPVRVHIERVYPALDIASIVGFS